MRRTWRDFGVELRRLRKYRQGWFLVPTWSWWHAKNLSIQNSLQEKLGVLASWMPVDMFTAQAKSVPLDTFSVHVMKSLKCIQKYGLI